MRRTGQLLIIGLLALTFSIKAQEVSKELGKLDPLAPSATLENLAKTHYDQLVKEHDAKLAELAKSGVFIVKSDTVLSVDKPLKIAFAWPVSYGQKLADKSNEKRDPYTIMLYPGKDSANKDAVQKWQISYKDGTVKAIQ
jgi:hypothetical protein